MLCWSGRRGDSNADNHCKSCNIPANLESAVTEATIQGVDSQFKGSNTSVWDALPYVYLLRVQLLTIVLLLSFPFIALWAAPNLLRGIFDVTPRGMTFVALAAILASWTVTVTASQVLRYGPERFHIQPFPIRRPIFNGPPGSWGQALAFAILAMPTILAAAFVSKNDGTSTYLWLVLGAAGGGVLAAGILVIGEQFKRRGWSKGQPVTSFLNGFGPGFKKDDGFAHDGHYVALWSFLLCLVVYLAVGIGKFFQIGYPAIVPTLADLLVFLMILCWGLSAITFILDYYRIPLLVPFLLITILSAHFHATDHYFHMFRAKNSLYLSPPQVIRAGKPGTKVIVVAASGGGIKAAAWTARVLTGLEETNPRIFGDSVRLISAVSGGSVGAMYFVSEYDADGKVSRRTHRLSKTLSPDRKLLALMTSPGALSIPIFFASSCPSSSISIVARLSKLPSLANCQTENIICGAPWRTGAKGSSKGGAPPWSSTQRSRKVESDFSLVLRTFHTLLGAPACGTPSSLNLQIRTSRSLRRHAFRLPSLTSLPLRAPILLARKSTSSTAATRTTMGWRPFSRGLTGLFGLREIQSGVCWS